jgi:SAM-dependent methyltransferase
MKHLDLGCGSNPRNPYQADELFGVDIHPAVTELGINFKHANLAVEGLPFEDHFFDSVSAFDVLEHIPRQAIDFKTCEVKLPFVQLMDEVWRVLKPLGMFYAFTPAYPSNQAFQDPTHVNFITVETHQYFCGEQAYAKRYGFKGQFKLVESQYMYATYAENAIRNRKIAIKNWHKTNIKPGRTHLVWQLQAQKKSHESGI